MKLIDRKTFLALTPGSIFAEYSATWGVGPWSVKGETILNEWPHDFFYRLLIEAEYGPPPTIEQIESKDRVGTELSLKYAESRDGCFDGSQLYYVLQPEDIVTISADLIHALRTGNVAPAGVSPATPGTQCRAENIPLIMNPPTEELLDMMKAIQRAESFHAFEGIKVEDALPENPVQWILNNLHWLKEWLDNPTTEEESPTAQHFLMHGDRKRLDKDFTVSLLMTLVFGAENHSTEGDNISFHYIGGFFQKTGRLPTEKDRVEVHVGHYLPIGEPSAYSGIPGDVFYRWAVNRLEVLPTHHDVANALNEAHSGLMATPKTLPPQEP